MGVPMRCRLFIKKSTVSLTDQFPLCRAPFHTLAVLTVLSLAIALANCCSAPVTTLDLKRVAESDEKVERAFGWPLVWYWRIATRVPETPATGAEQIGVQWDLSRCSIAYLFSNVGAWLAMLAIASAGCQWIFRRYCPRRGWPRATTLIVLITVSVAIALANLSLEASSGKVSFGWPLAWYWLLIVANWVPPHVYGWDFSARGLALNLVVWLLLLSTVGFISEWATDRFLQRLQWSLRTMLVAVGFVAALCAWRAGLWKRAEEQDALIAWKNGDWMYCERWGPKWLDLIGADRFRRRLVGARIAIQAGDEQDERHFERLAQLRSLRYLEVTFYGITPAVAAMLGRMRELHTLRLGYEDEDGDDAGNATHAYLAAVGELIQLRQLCLEGGLQLRGDDIRCLRSLANLKSLTLDLDSAHDSERTRECLLAVRQLNQLEQLYLWNWSGRRADLARLGGLTNLRSLTLCPVEIGVFHRANTYIDSNTSDSNRGLEGFASLRALRQLEGLDLTGVRVAFQDVRALAVLPRLKFLCLGQTQVDHASLTQLAAIKSLEELALDEATLIRDLKALNALTRLKAVHISPRGVAGARLALDHGDHLSVSPSEVEHFRSELEEI